MKTSLWPTVSFGHSLRDLHQDTRVAKNHDDQRQQEQADKSEHIVERLLPVFDEAASCGALGKVGRGRDGHDVKYEHLLKNTRIS